MSGDPSTASPATGTETHGAAPATDPAPDARAATTQWSQVPALTPGTAILGEYLDSGYTEAHYLLRRADGQVVNISRLVYVVVSSVDGERDIRAIAGEVSARLGRRIDADGVHFLLAERLQPAGIVALTCATPGANAGWPEGSSRPPVQDAPLTSALLSLRFRRVLIAPRVTRVVAAALAPLFAGPVVALVLVGLVVADLWAIRNTDAVGAIGAVIAEPPLLLAVLVVVLAATLMHELGHAAACRRGGAVPGAVGVGFYVVYPAFYTDVTDSYRLGRAGRVRTDLGGVYLNAVAIVILIMLHALTGSPVLLVAVLLVHLELVQQLIPLGRLDGYFLITDLVGVPDLLGRAAATLRRRGPDADQGGRLHGLSRVARIAVTGWAVLVIPAMIGMLVAMIWALPTTTRQTLDGLDQQWLSFEEAVRSADLPSGMLAALSLVLLPLPLLGMAVIVVTLVRRALALAARSRHRGPHTP